MAQVISSSVHEKILSDGRPTQVGFGIGPRENRVAFVAVFGKPVSDSV
jgi:hypothetical protein